MSTASPEKQTTYSHSPTPALSDVELSVKPLTPAPRQPDSAGEMYDMWIVADSDREAAVLRSVVDTRPGKSTSSRLSKLMERRKEK